MITNERKKVVTEKFKKSKVYIGYSPGIDDVYENLQEYNPTKKKKNFDSVWWYESRHGI